MVRMDALYTGFWIFAIFIKAALLIYCAAVTLPGSGGYKGKCLAPVWRPLPSVVRWDG